MMKYLINCVTELRFGNNKEPSKDIKQGRIMIILHFTKMTLEQSGEWFVKEQKQKLGDQRYISSDPG